MCILVSLIWHQSHPLTWGRRSLSPIQPGDVFEVTFLLEILIPLSANQVRGCGAAESCVP